VLQKLLVVAAACLASNLIADQPLLHAHSHNDYAHPHPLTDALDNYFCSVEADIFLVQGQLLVGHTSIDLQPNRTLQSLYLDPLKQRIAENGGTVYRNGPTFTLMIDIKTEAKTTYIALAKVLRQYRELLSEFDGEARTARAIEVIISGNRDFETIEADTPRFAGVDGRIADLESKKPATLMPMISDRWAGQFAWTGIGDFPKEQRDKLHAAVAKAHSAGRRVRFWATPENEAVWRELKAARVDLINTDKLQELRRWLEAQ
jgi:Glycerophosphoryl diester phosphodiesterase family